MSGTVLKFKPSGLGSQRGRLPRTASTAIVVQALWASKAIDEIFLALSQSGLQFRQWHRRLSG